MGDICVGAKKFREFTCRCCLAAEEAGVGQRLKRTAAAGGSDKPPSRRRGVTPTTANSDLPREAACVRSRRLGMQVGHRLIELPGVKSGKFQTLLFCSSPKMSLEADIVLCRIFSSRMHTRVNACGLRCYAAERIILSSYPYCQSFHDRRALQREIEPRKSGVQNVT